MNDGRPSFRIREPQPRVPACAGTTGVEPFTSSPLNGYTTLDSPPDWAGRRDGLLAVPWWRTLSGMDSRPPPARG